MFVARASSPAGYSSVSLPRCPLWVECFDSVLAPGRGGYIKAALRTGAPIVPLAVVGAEEAHVMLGKVAIREGLAQAEQEIQQILDKWHR